MKFMIGLGLLLWLTGLNAGELKVRRIEPTQAGAKLKRIYIHFSEDVVGMGDFDKQFSEVTISNGKKCTQRWINPKTLKCTFKEKLDFGSYTVSVKKGLRGLKKKKLVKAFSGKINIKAPQPKTNNSHYGNQRKYEDRFRIRSVRCSGKHNQITKYYKNENINISEVSRVDCQRGDTVSIEFDGNIDSKESLPSYLLTDDKALEEKINLEIKNSEIKNQYYYDRMLSFTLPDEEKEMKFTLHPSVKGMTGKDRYTGELTAPLGFKTLIITTHPKKPQFHYSYSNGILERNGPLRVYFEYVNISEIKFDASYLKENLTRKGGEVERSGSIKLTGEENTPNRWYFDLEKELGLKKGHSYFIKLDLENGPIRPEVEKSYNLFNYYSRDKGFDKTYKSEIQITNLGLHIKKGYFNSLAYVFTLDKGEPVKGAEIFIEGVSQWESQGKTNKDGFLVFQGRAKEDIGKVIAVTGDDFVQMDTNKYYVWDRGIRSHDFKLPFHKLNKKTNFIVETISDRPIYKPGDEVRLKVFSREWSNKSLKFITDYKELEVTVKNSRGETVHDKRLEINEFGTAMTKFSLPADAKTGDYRVSVRNFPDGRSGSVRSTNGFKVEEYRLSPIKVITKANKISDKLVKVNAAVEYHFGGAPKEAKGEIIITYQDIHFTPKDKALEPYFWWWYYYDDYDYSYHRPKMKLLSREMVLFNEKGKFEDEILLERLSNVGTYGNLSIEVNTEDSHGAKIADRKSIIYGTQKYFVGSKSMQWSYEENSKLKIEAVLLDLNQKQIFNESAELILIKQEYISTRRKGSGNYYYYDYKREDKEIGKCTFKFAQTRKTCDLKVKGSGSYYYKIVSKGKRKFKDLKNWVYVWGGSGYVSQQHYNHSRIDILTDKKEYEMGEKAQIMIQSPYKEAEALLTLERHGIIETKRIKLKGSMHQVELDLSKPEYAPGVFISVLVVKERTSDKVEGTLDLGKPSFRLGYNSIKIKTKQNKLTVGLKTKKDAYEPGEKIEFSLNVNTHKIKGASSEVAVAVVDDAILQLVPGYIGKYKLHDKFYELGNHGVENFQTLINIIGRQTFGKKGGNAGGGGGAQGDMANLLRDNFKAVAYWNPRVSTDKNGKAKFSFIAPDNLTGWTVIAVAVDKNHRFGTGESSFKVNKKIMIEPALPNFLTENDRLNGKVVVHSRLKTDEKVKVSLESKLFSLPKPSQSVVVKSNDSSELLFPVNAKGPGEYVLRIKAEGTEYGDYMENKIPVVAIASNNTQVISGLLEGKEINQPIKFPSTIRENSQKMSITYSNSMLSNLKEAFSYVLKYPYGCWEQRMSKAIFWAQYEGLKEFMGDIPNIPKGNPVEIVNTWLGKAHKYQASDGGMMYYPSNYGESNPYLSVYTGEVFTIIENLSQDNSFKIPVEVKEKLSNYFRDLLSKKYNWPRWYDAGAKLSIAARVLYILDQWKSRDVDKFLNNFLKDDMASIPLSAKSYLIMVLKKNNKVRKGYEKFYEKLKSSVEGKIHRESSYLSFTEDYTPGKYFLYTSMRLQCKLFTALNKTSFLNSSDESQFLKYLMKKRRNGRWYNTQENMYCFEAVQAYIKNKNFSDKPMSIMTSLDKEKINETKLKNKITKPISFSIPQDKLKIGKDMELKLKPSENRSVFYSMTLSYTDMELTKKSIDNGFTINKYIYLLDNKSNSWKPLDGDLKLTRGDILKIVLVVETDQERHQVGIHDPLAAAFEPINFNLGTTSILTKALKDPVKDKRYDTPFYDYFGDYFQGNGFHYADLRLQAAQFYADYLAKDTQYVVEYGVSVTASGSFYADATKVEEMYYPDVYGLTPARKVIVTE